MADDEKNIGPEAEKPGEVPQEKKAEPIKDTPPAPEQPAPGAPQAPVVEAAPKAQPAPTVESQPVEKAAPAPKVLDFSAAKNKAPAKEETSPEKKPVKEQTEEKPKRGRPAKADKAAPAEKPKQPRDKIDMLNNVQQLIYAIAFKNGSLRGTIPKKIKEDCALCATGMFAASVGIRLKSNELCDIHRETPLTTTLRDFNHLFMAANDKDRLREFLSTQNPRVAVKYRALLQSLLSSKTGIKINNASPNNETFIKHFSTKELSSNLILINSEIEEIVEPITVCGRLVGANVERCSFEFITVSNESIKGQLTPALSSSVFSVPQSVEADIEIRIGSDSMTREEKLLYTLTAIRPIVPQSETEI